MSDHLDDKALELQGKVNIPDLVEETENEYNLLPAESKYIPIDEHVSKTVLANIGAKLNRPYGVSINVEEARILSNDLRKMIMQRYGFSEDTLPAKIRQAFVDFENKLIEEKSRSN